MHRRRFLGVAGAAVLLAPKVRAEQPSSTIEGRLRRLTASGGGDNRANYTPDGRRLLFASRRTGLSQIWSMAVDGGDVQHVYKTSSNEFGRVAPSPDGARLCFSSDRAGLNAIYILETKSGEVRPVSNPARWSFGPTWSKADRIAYFARNAEAGIDIWTVSADGSDARQITHHRGESRQPWWSPDGSLLAFSADEGTGSFQIHLASADGSDERSITRNGEWQQPFWSPDGSRLAVSARLASRHFRIFVMDAAGRNIRPIKQPADADNVHPAWSPDGRMIAFTSGKADAGCLWQFTFD
jgi:TolB protein